jgi:diguanylate cyclase (GGDEF)-like protein
MTSTTKFIFEGYEGLIRIPLERADPRSFALVRKLLENALNSPACPFSFLIKTLSSVEISPGEARGHWKKILGHKLRLELKLCRTVNIRTACIDYCDQLGIDTPPATAQVPEKKAAGTAQKTHAAPSERADLYQERLREEMMRARRYKHALSVILFDVDLGAAAPEVADKALTVIMNLINKIVRTVDIPARHTDGCFLLMLPDTNKREALELAERLKNNLCLRINRIPEISVHCVHVIIALGQCSKEDTAADFIKRLEYLTKTVEGTDLAVIRVLE